MSTQVERLGDSSLAELEDAALREEVLAERSLLEHVVRGIAIAVPVSVVIWATVSPLCVHPTSSGSSYQRLRSPTLARRRKRRVFGVSSRA